MKKLILSLILPLITTPVLAQVPIDPLKLPDVEAGSYVYTFGLGYNPDGQERIFADFFGEPIIFQRSEQGYNLNFSGSYSFNQNLSIYGNILPSLLIREDTQRFGDQSITNRETNTDLGGNLSVEYGFAPEAVLNPRLSLGVSYPLGINVQTSTTLIKDPVILLGSLGYNRSLEYDEDRISFGIGASFIANDNINFTATADHSIPLQDNSFTTTSLSFRTGYTLDQMTGSELGFKTNLSVNARETRIGFSLEFGGRGKLGSVFNNTEIENNENTENTEPENISPEIESNPNQESEDSTINNTESNLQEEIPVNINENNVNVNE